MIVFRHQLSWRDMMLLLLGASFMHLVTVFYPIGPTETSFIINTHVHDVLRQPLEEKLSRVADIDGLPPPISQIDADNDNGSRPPTEVVPPIAFDASIGLAQDIGAGKAEYSSSTTVTHHAPGYTLFQNLYMSNGTLYILADPHETRNNPNLFPEIRMMMSVSMFADGSPENIAAREPTKEVMTFISPEEARRRWGDRVFEVEGNTVLFNDPSQFLRHYYHFVAELWFGVQAFWHGAFSSPISSTVSPSYTSGSSSHPSDWNWNAYPISSEISHPSLYQLHNHPSPPPIHRSVFMHATADGWRDTPGFNSFFLRAAYPSMDVEHEEDWQDRVSATSGKDRAWVFSTALLVDRSAAFRDVMTGGHTQRTAAQAWEYMRNHGKLRGERVGGWWEPVRDAVLKFAGVLEDFPTASADLNLDLSMPKNVVITYISRQAGVRRKLTPASHESLVKALEDLAQKRGIELIVMEAEKLTKAEQLQIISKTTFLLGPHGNGLTHLVFMPPTKLSTVIEIFYPGGFAHDYHWTSRALGMKHFGVWNDTFYTHPNEPDVEYPEGFQEDYIPVYGPTVAKIIEDRLDGKV